MQEHADYVDRDIVLLKRAYHNKLSEEELLAQTVRIGAESYHLKKAVFFAHQDCPNGRFTMMIPDYLEDMDNLYASVKYLHSNRPEIIKTDEHNNVTFTYSIVRGNRKDGEEKNILNQLVKIKDGMEKVFKQNRYYDMEELQADSLDIAWFDYKGHCLDGPIYCLLFIFYMNEDLVLGNFQCSFSIYDNWKSAVLKMLTTIQIDLSVIDL